MVFTGALEPRWALILAAFFEFTGAIFLGTAVAETFTQGIIKAVELDINVVWAALLSALGWNVLAGYRGVPSSSTHAIIGGLMGAVLISIGYEAVIWWKIIEVLLVLIFSPILGIVFGFLLTKMTHKLFGSFSPKTVRRNFLRYQIASSAALSLSHGTNDAQKTMGVITLALIILYHQNPEAMRFFYDGGSGSYIPIWVKISCASAISLGVLTGGFRIMKTLGGGIYKIRSVHGFSAQTSSAVIIYLSALLGFPVSTTQVVSSSIVGAGTAERANAVRWEVVGNILATWLITVPSTVVIGAGIYLLIDTICEHL